RARHPAWHRRRVAAHPRARRAEPAGADRSQHRGGDARRGARARRAVGLQLPGRPADREPDRVELPRHGRRRRLGAERRLGAGGAAGSASTATEKINTGITLVVTPQVSADGYVLMSIYAKSSQPDFTQGRSVDGIPNEISREANSNVLIQDGQTVVLGGIFR